jgi:DNA polymerase-3 subunit alpha
MGSSFVHLHNHTEYSMLDGAAKISPMLAEAQRHESEASDLTLAIDKREVTKREAIAAAHAAIDRADLRVALAAPGQRFIDHWPDAWRVRSQCDLSGTDPAGTQHRVSATTGHGIAELATAIREALVPATDLACDRPFDFR